MKITPCHPRHGRTRPLAIPLGMALAACLLAPMAASAAPAPGLDSVKLASFEPRYPKTCAGLPRRGSSGQTGLCLLASVEPRASGEFRIRPVTGPAPADPTQGQAVPLNAFLALAPGQYEIYATNGMDSQSPGRFTIANGQVFTLRTATLGFTRSFDQKARLPRVYKLQRQQPVDGTNNGGCLADFPSRGPRAYLPGSFLVQPPVTGMPANPQCERSGVAFNVLAGQGYRIRPARVAEQDVPANQTFVHPNRVSALTSVMPYNHGIAKFAWLSRWTTHRGLANPEVKMSSALALYGLGSITYLVPVNVRQNVKFCGKSLARGGSGAQKLLSDCTFRNGRLTGFTVNPGAYYTYHNLYGKPAVDLLTLNSAIKVTGVNFKLP
jgi:hypothetical protein